MHRGIGNSTLTIAHLLILLFVGGALGLYVARPGAGPNDTAAGPQVSVRAERIQLSGDDSHAEVVLQVQAGPQDLGPVEIFWSVTVPEDEQPWQAPRYVSPAQTLPSLAADSSVEVRWPAAPLALLPGDYTLSGWVHQIIAPGQTQHLAGGSIGSFSITHPVPSSIRLTEGAFADSLGPLALEAVNIDQPSPADQRVAVEASVANHGPEPVSGRAYWLLGRLPDDQPFRAPFWQAHWLDVPSLQPGAATSLAWSEPVDLPAGTYGLSVWVHTRNGSDWQHSDRSFNVPLQLGPNRSGVQRAGPPIAEVRIQVASLAQDGLIHVRIDNSGPEQHLWTATDLLPEERRFDWYRASPPPRAMLTPLVLAGGAATSIDLPLLLDCSVDAHLARLAVYAVDAPPDASPLDDVLLDVCP